jgi:hypothetical protein
MLRFSVQPDPARFEGEHDMGVFVSYSSRDKDAVTRLTQDLQDTDEQVWLDQRLGGGDAWWRAILEQIRGCDVFIFALSQNSIQSKPCQAELHYAQELGLPILPVQVGPVDSMQLNPLATVQTVDYRTSTSTAGMRLLAALHRARTQRQPLPSPLPAEPTVPFEYLIRLYTTIAGTDQLSPRDQAALVTQLQFGLREDGDHDAARKDIAMLLTKLRDREDVTYRTRTDVDSILAALEPEVPALMATSTQPASTGSHPAPGDDATRPQNTATTDTTEPPTDAPKAKANLDRPVDTPPPKATAEKKTPLQKIPPQPATTRVRQEPPLPSRRRRAKIIVGAAAFVVFVGVGLPMVIIIWNDTLTKGISPRDSGLYVPFVVGFVCLGIAGLIGVITLLMPLGKPIRRLPDQSPSADGSVSIRTRSPQQDDDRPLTKRIPDYLRAHPHSTAAAVAEALGSSTDIASSTLSELKNRGLVNNAVDGHTTREWIAVT